MRIKLTLKQVKENQLIPINYQYALSSFIYTTIEKSDPRYSRWLHDRGFLLGKKSFKFFTFSMFDLPKRIKDDINLSSSKEVNKEKRFSVMGNSSNQKRIEIFYDSKKYD